MPKIFYCRLYCSLTTGHLATTANKKSIHWLLFKTSQQRPPLQRPLSSIPKEAFVERFNNLLGKDSLPHNLFIHVTQQRAHCVTRQKRLRGRLRNTVIWLDISDILFTSGLVWTGTCTWLYTKGAFHSAKILFEISEISCAKWIAYILLAQTQPKPLGIWFVLVSRIQKSSTEDNSFVKLKGTFLSDLPNNQTSQSGPPSKLVSNILVRMKLNGLLWCFISILKKICRNLWKLNCNKVESDKSHIMALHDHFSVSDITHLKMQWNMYNIFGLFQGSFSPQLPSR